MNLDWYPAIRECCSFWPDAENLQQTFQAMEQSFTDNNDACIDCAKSVVEVICRIIIDELDNTAAPIKPKESHPSFSKWVSAAIGVLKIADDRRQSAFNGMVSQHHKLTVELGTLRNEAGPVSHGREAFVDRLSIYHRRAAVLSADAIVAFLHGAYLEAEVKIGQTKQPYERFGSLHANIDRSATIELTRDEDGQHLLTVALGQDEFVVPIDPSQVLFHFDRTAYVEALKLGKDIEAEWVNSLEPAIDLSGLFDPPTNGGTP
jgi:Abortive infection C-terminus